MMEILQFPITIRQTLLPRIEEPMTTVLAEAAYSSTNFDYPIRKYTPADRLAVLVILLSKKYDAYQSMGVSREIILNTFRDVTLRANLYQGANGEIGLSEADSVWFRHIMNAEIFQIGPLQFQPFEMIYLDEETLGDPYMDFSAVQKERLPSGTPVINCHIPSGAKLDPAAVQSAFSLAAELFPRWFPRREFKAFLCYSWLLYPPMQSLLKDDSRIRQFAKLFEILGNCQDSEQAFECLYANTALFKSASEQPEKFGFACGYIPISRLGES